MGKFTFGKLPLGEKTLGKLPLGKSPLGKYLTSGKTGGDNRWNRGNR